MEGDDDHLGKGELISFAVRRLGTTSIALALALAASTLAAPCRAQDAAPPPDKEACVASFDRGQKAQSDRALRRALADLIVCAQESCPTVLRADCAGVLAEVRSALPTIVFAADDGNGRELTDVQVHAGPELLTSKLDGRAIPVDPGAIELRFESPGQPTVVTTWMVREGEKSRVIRVSLGKPTTPEPATEGAGGPRRTTPTPPRSTLGWVLPGSLVAVGLAGLGVALGERLSFDGHVDDLRGSCAPDCTQAQRSDLSSTLVASNVSLGVGLGALALGVVTWFLTAPAAAGPSSGARAAARAFVVPGGIAW